MDKIALIKAEIERLKGKLIRGACAAQIEMETNCKDEAYNEVLAFLDTLSEEPDKDLEGEVKNYFQGYWPGTETAEQCNTDLHFTPPAILRLARHFAEWQAEKDKETIELAEDHAYLAGAVNEREQMMKEAVEGYVNYYEDSGGILMAEAQVGCPYHNGDKVKLIIIKEE